MDGRPCALIVSSSNTKPKSLIKLITKTNLIDENDSEIIVHSWPIDTKYYTAKINLAGISKEYQRNEDFNNRVEALIIHMDSNKESGLDDLKVWEGIEDDCDPDIKLLVANYCTQETKITREKATDWCLKKGFEFIELYPSFSNSNLESDQDSIIEEKLGAERIIEALHTHTWSNLLLKSEGNPKHVDTNDAEPDNSLDGRKLENVCEEYFTEDAVDEFTELFSQLHMMRDSLHSLPTGQRKQCAEQMVTAFWKAIGGDEEEVTDL